MTKAKSAFLVPLIFVSLLLTLNIGCGNRYGPNTASIQIGHGKKFSIVVYGPTAGLQPEFQYRLLDPTDSPSVKFLGRERVETNMDGGTELHRFHFQALESGEYKIKFFKKDYCKSDFTNNSYEELPDETTPELHRTVNIKAN